MNLTPNNLFPASGSTALGGVAGSSDVTSGMQSAVKSLENHDWFSEQALGEGSSINAASFSGGNNFSSVEHAAEQIFSKLIPDNSNNNVWS